MTREDIIRMAREAGLDPDLWNYTDAFERYAYLIAAAERNACAQWMMARGFATGHGDSVADLLTELEWQVREREREACAKVCDQRAIEDSWEGGYADACAEAIRARGKK